MVCIYQNVHNTKRHTKMALFKPLISNAMETPCAVCNTMIRKDKQRTDQAIMFKSCGHLAHVHCFVQERKKNNDYGCMACPSKAKSNAWIKSDVNTLYLQSTRKHLFTYVGSAPVRESIELSRQRNFSVPSGPWKRQIKQVNDRENAIQK